MIGEEPFHDGLYRGPLLVGHEPAVGGDRCLLRLGERALDRAELVAQPGRHPIEQLLGAGGRLALDGTPLRAPDVEPVAACHHQVIHAHQLLHDGPIAAAHHADGATCGKPTHRVPRALGDDRILRPVDDRRERTVVVEEHSGPPAGQALGERFLIRERVRQVGDARRAHAHPVSASRRSMQMTFSQGCGSFLRWRPPGADPSTARRPRRPKNVRAEAKRQARASEDPFRCEN
jgi:hypothetical protein